MAAFIITVAVDARSFSGAAGFKSMRIDTKSLGDGCQLETSGCQGRYRCHTMPLPDGRPDGAGTSLECGG